MSGSLSILTGMSPDAHPPNDEANSLASYAERQAELQALLEQERAKGGLAAALMALYRQQLDCGFIRDPLDEVRRFSFEGRAYAADHFRVQFNPARARRFGGVGPARPPEGVEVINGGCFLCRENIRWQSRGLEMGYALPKPLDRYVAWMNPFPLAPAHCILASHRHEPQHWHGQGKELVQLAGELIDLVDQLPGWIGFYNGVGAGASIPGHLHHHLMPRPGGQAAFPMEQSFAAFGRDGWTSKVYPMAFMHWHGEVASLKTRLRPWLMAWHDRVEREATANIIVLNPGEGEPLQVVFVPRHPARSRAEGLGGMVGAFEALGEIICSSPEEFDRIERGEIDYSTIAGMLSQVSIAP
ncbi:DUF4922 domain-containing protein [Wenzhouxiangella marina]|uniref:DUF4922 domain-containing protein n=1 Tax=Wenzhouxiangella marina TaxID=1579979 RepID=A0A0K0XTW9_9GAMM|nr:DUF4922 domain-containing protein [Wenzhouxiangella marina]AKS41128.1 hypothetical protein WM2015_747 [Wenzhouxiangella marina]MBB6088007.1 diadenosine tetraphosphate (Ap4A) HIT family hydrolase [Wenzhouxiangella marina]